MVKSEMYEFWAELNNSVVIIDLFFISPGISKIRLSVFLIMGLFFSSSNSQEAENIYLFNMLVMHPDKVLIWSSANPFPNCSETIPITNQPCDGKAAIPIGRGLLQDAHRV